MKAKRISCLRDGLKMLCIQFLATAAALLFRRLGFTESNIVVVYILAVLMTARVTDGYLFGIVASIFSLLGFNYFFTAPFLSLSVYDTSYFTTFAIMTATSIVTSTLTSKAKRLTTNAEEKEKESRILYTLSSRLQEADSAEEIARTAAENIHALLGREVICISVDQDKQPVTAAVPELEKESLGRIEEAWGRLPGNREETLAGYVFYPMKGRDKPLGAVGIRQETEGEGGVFRSRLLFSVIDTVAIALDRMAVIKEQMTDREEIVRERDRGNLLRAISHDLRTPLSGIMGTTEILLNMTEQSDRRYGMLQGIYMDSDWLYSLVNNILSLTRLQDGRIVIHKEMEALEEVIETALARLAKVRPDREIQVTLPEEFHLVPMDARLIAQVIGNLLDNAVKHTPADKSIEIAVSYGNGTARVSVRDEGEGIAPCDLDHVFQMFYTSRTRTADARNGVGLGLAICETVIKAHGGRIEAENRKDCRGAEFWFALPLEEKS